MTVAVGLAAMLALGIGGRYPVVETLAAAGLMLAAIIAARGRY